MENEIIFHYGNTVIRIVLFYKSDMYIMYIILKYDMLILFLYYVSVICACINTMDVLKIMSLVLFYRKLQQIIANLILLGILFLNFFKN